MNGDGECSGYLPFFVCSEVFQHFYSPFDRKKFRPHITLIRKVSYKTDQRLPLELLQHERMVVNRISLMKSERGKNGMVYTEIGYIESEKA